MRRFHISAGERESTEYVGFAINYRAFSSGSRFVSAAFCFL
jgi:hypothetical protein